MCLEREREKWDERECEKKRIREGRDRQNDKEGGYDIVREVKSYYAGGDIER